MCHIVPMGAALVTSLIWRRKKTQKMLWLNLMFYGGALFGVIDHLWNKELFLISKYLVKDLALGVVISLGIFVSWSVLVAISKTNPALMQCADNRVKA